MLLIIILGLLVVLVRKHTKGTRMQQLECVAYSNEIMDMTSIGDIKVPLAFGTRTRPMIEHDYFP